MLLKTETAEANSQQNLFAGIAGASTLEDQIQHEDKRPTVAGCVHVRRCFLTEPIIQ